MEGSGKCPIKTLETERCEMWTNMEWIWFKSRGTATRNRYLLCSMLLWFGLEWYLKETPRKGHFSFESENKTLSYAFGKRKGYTLTKGAESLDYKWWQLMLTDTISEKHLLICSDSSSFAYHNILKISFPLLLLFQFSSFFICAVVLLHRTASVILPFLVRFKIKLRGFGSKTRKLRNGIICVP